MTPQQIADAYRRATGSVSATYRVEQRNLDGTLTVISEATSEAECDA